MRLTSFFLISLCSLANTFAQTETPKLRLSHLTDNFYVFTTYKSFQGQPFPANGMYVVTDCGVALFDSPWDSTQFQPLLDSIWAKHGKKVIMCLATHSHEDRTGGLSYYRKQGINTFTTRQTDKICQERNEKRAEFLLASDTTFKLGTYTFQTYYPGPGHAPDNIVVWFKEQQILYGGCLVKSVEAANLGFLGDANIDEWGNSIRRIQAKFRHPKYIVPGHQSWSSTYALAHTLRLLKADKETNNAKQ